MVDATKGVGTTMSSSWPCETTAFRSPVARSPSGSLKPCNNRVHQERNLPMGTKGANPPWVVCRPFKLEALSGFSRCPSAANAKNARVVHKNLWQLQTSTASSMLLI